MELLILSNRLLLYIAVKERCNRLWRNGYAVLFVAKKTRDRIREDTVLKNYPLYCPKCRQETLIEVKNLQTINEQI